MRLPDGDGLDIVRYITEQHAQMPVAVITAYGSTENAVAALKAGAFDYLAKPVGLEQLRALVKSALARAGRSKASDDPLQSLIGESAAMEQVRALIEKLARSQAPIYVSGESGQRQGTRRAPDPRAQCACRGPVRSGQLRRDSRKPDGERILRLSQGRLYRCRQRSRRLFPGGQRRHAVSRRGRRSAAGHAGQAAARDSGKTGAQGRVRPPRNRSMSASSARPIGTCGTASKRGASARICITG